MDTITSKLESNEYESLLKECFSAESALKFRKRVMSLFETVTLDMHESQPIVLSVPGRTELAGNHTDHNHGMVIAASVDVDMLAVVFPVSKPVITVFSEGYRTPVIVDATETGPFEEETGTSASLVRGMAAALQKRGYRIGGFTAYITSDIPQGAGMSSSAAFEILMGEIFNQCYNDGKIGKVEIAQAGQSAENDFYGKPCGLMDQIACAYGGIVQIDFRDTEYPVITEIPGDRFFDDYILSFVKTGKDHSQLTGEYQAIQDEMKACAQLFGKPVLREISLERFLDSLKVIRGKVPDRAILRALHFFQENKRVEKMAKAAINNQIGEYFALVNESGLSSWRFLQNCSVNGEYQYQGICIALAMTELFLNKTGAARVHGGGFEGTIQCYIPKERIADYISSMEPVFGRENIIVTTIRKSGVLVLR